MANDTADSQQEEPVMGNLPSGKPRTFIGPMLAEVIGGVSSLLAAGVTARRLIEERAYKNVSSLHFIEDLKKLRAEYGPMLAQQVEAGKITEEEGYKKLQEGVKLFESKIEQRFKKGGIRGIGKEFGLLRDHQKLEIGISALSAGGITLGAILLLGRELFTAEEVEKLNDKAKTLTNAQQTFSTELQAGPER